MKHITVKLTQDQATLLTWVLSYEANYVQNNDYPRGERNNAFVERIRVKISKELAKAENS